MNRTSIRKISFVIPVLALLAGTTAHASEVERVRGHLDGALELLAAADVTHLGDAQRAARARNVERLRAYRDRGVFPQNRDFPHRAVPYFRDAEGVLCAMAHLIHESGEPSLVDRVARTRNNATVHELADEPGLAEWLETNGLTLEEAARIQPWYWSGTVTACTGEQRVAVGVCSKPVAVEIVDRWGDRMDGSAQIDNYAGQPVRYYSDASCTSALARADSANLPLRDGVGVFHFVAEEKGTLDLTISYGGSVDITQSHQIVEASAAPGGPGEATYLGADDAEEQRCKEVSNDGSPAGGCSAIPVTGGAASILISLCVLRGRRHR